MFTSGICPVFLLCTKIKIIKQRKYETTELNSKLNDNRIGFPNYGKVLGTYTNQTFTAPQNCWAKVQITSGWNNSTLSVNGNGILIQQMQNTSAYPIKVSTMIPLKKGDVVTMSAASSTNGIVVTLYDIR